MQRLLLLLGVQKRKILNARPGTSSGMGMHSFRRANITWRQGVGKASAIEASKIAGHATVSMTGEYTFVPLERQDETTRRIQQRLDTAKAKVVEIRRKKAVVA